MGDSPDGVGEVLGRCVDQEVAHHPGGHRPAQVAWSAAAGHDEDAAGGELVVQLTGDRETVPARQAGPDEGDVGVHFQCGRHGFVGGL
ncbi:hypothetical protein GCM10023196_085380 [Actinoallomurus vinaceus]|uniref:Uncharacterized protein n=1 Tax=Actinoallomurus vinaceus TaxID=1080074 RepID=A0ABP8URH9_9ACTN